jgi:hypothetical protein
MADPAEADEERDDHTESSVLKDLRVKAKRTDDAEARAAKAERELGLARAGLDHLDEDQVTALVGTGDFDAEAVKAKAEKWGWTKKAEQSAEVAQPAADEAAAQAQTELAAMAQFASTPATPAEPARGTVDLSQYTNNDALKAYLMANIDESFGPEVTPG